MNQRHHLFPSYSYSLASAFCVWVIAFSVKCSLFLEGKTTFWVVIAGDRECCVVSDQQGCTSSWQVLHSSSALARSHHSPVPIRSAWYSPGGPFPPWNKPWPYPRLIHDTVTCSDSCEQHWQDDRFLRAAKGNRHSPAVHPSHTLQSLSPVYTSSPYVTSATLKCIGFMSSLTCGQRTYKSSRSSGGVVTTHGHVLQAALSFNFHLLFWGMFLSIIKCSIHNYHQLH